MFADRVKIFTSEHPTAPTQREGVAVVLNKKLISTKNVTATEIVPGRALQVAVPWRGGDVRQILCVYAPTTEGALARKEFFVKLREFYERAPDFPRPHLMAGDFNNVEDALDRVPVPADGRDVSVEALDDLKASLGLMMTDGWRATNPTGRGFTYYRGVAPNISMSRLDRMYIRQSELKWAREWSITPVGVKTDHSLVSVLLTTPLTPEVGKGRPVFPLFLLTDKKLKVKMKERGMQAARELEDVARLGRTTSRNPQLVLSALKKDWLEMARQRERTLVPELTKEIEERERRLEVLQKNPAPLEQSFAEEMKAITEQLRHMKARRTRQQQNGMRAKHRVHGESPTKYWTRLHKTPAPRELIPAFEKEGERTRTGERVYETDATAMAEIARAHHDGIQRDGPDVAPPEQRRRDMDEALESITTQVTDEQAGAMGAAISMEECELALRFAKSGTAPGLDGIQYEVWKTMQARYVEDSRHPARTAFNVLKVICEALRDIHEHGVLEGSSFAQGWMSPIYKEKGELTKVVNYRPITLLNTDYKLLTKVLAMRLADVADDIVHPAQAGFVPGRRLHNHTQLARMMREWAEVTEENGAIVALDQEKAYDKIAHDYLWEVLKKFGIPEAFSKIIKSLYASAVTSVVINGVTSKAYRVYRGVRQGDPLSCLLFDLAIEPLSAMIRASPLKGFNIPNSTTSLKATLFADDTTVYLAETDDFAILQRVLDVWCSAAKARFNIKKTEIIPIGSAEFRDRMARTYASTGAWQNYPRDVHVAADGTAVRILGAFMGNKVEQCEVWSPKLEKVSNALDKWNKGHMTLTGKGLVVQMVVGGMTQFMTNVQRMPEQVAKRFTKLIRDFVWDDKPYTPVAMDYLYLPREQGGIGLLDIAARNDAIDVMWLKAYLAQGTPRPLWALVADDLLARAAPKDAVPRELALRSNTFTQNWSPKLRGLMPELKAIVEAAKKWGLRQEGLAFSRNILHAMPIWDHAHSDLVKIHRLAGRSAASLCLKKNHGVRTVGECEELAAGLNGRAHTGTSGCTCESCERRITTDGCSNPHRCYVRAKLLLDTLPPKWDPRGTHQEDYELATQADEPEGDSESVFDGRVTTTGALSDTFRIFTDAEPLYEGRFLRPTRPCQGAITVATDGACIGNGNQNAAAGAGVFVEEGHRMNRAVRLPKHLEQTNQTGEMVATLIAIQGVEDALELTQETDSKSVIQSLTSLRKQHEDAGYIQQKNANITRAVLAALRARCAPTIFKWVKGHNGHTRNEGADALAGQAARLPPNSVVDLAIPPELRLSGAKLAAMTQKLAYTAIRQRLSEKLPPRRATRAAITAIVGDLERSTGVVVKEQTIWTSLTKREVTRECRQFIWKAIHDAFMIGRHWLRPSMSDRMKERAMCKKCDELESMDHILFRCGATGGAKIWELLRDVWSSTGYTPRDVSWGTTLGAACIPRGDGEGRNGWSPSSTLWTTLATESVYLVWKLRCERVIQNEGKDFTNEEVANRWYTAINARLSLDRFSTTSALGEKAMPAETVRAVWEPILQGANSLPTDWVGRYGVLVGIRRVGEVPD
ncbi:hypothetical protein VTO73DRAFT_10280 [Trametes versicolor]